MADGEMQRNEGKRKVSSPNKTATDEIDRVYSKRPLLEESPPLDFLFQTAGGISVSVSEASKHKAAHLFDEGGAPPMAGLQTAGGKSVTVSEASKNKAAHLFDEGGAPPMAGLQTAGGKSVTVSDASKHKAAHLFDEGGAPPMAGLQTAGGKSVTVSDASKHKAAHLFDEGGAPPMAGLQTAGGKSVTVSDASKHKAAHLFDEGGAPPMAGLQTAGGKSVTVSEASKNKAAHLFDEGGAPPMAGLQTAGGKSVTVSDASKHKAAHLFDEGGAPPMAGLQTAGGKSVTVSEASKNKAAHLFDEGGAPPMAGLQTAGGKSVTVSDASKHKAAHLFDEGGAPPMAGLQTAGGKSVTVSDASKHKAAHLFDEGGAPPMAGLQTAGGKSVTVSDASKHKAAHLFDEGGAPPMAGLQTAGGKSVTVSDASKHKAAHLFDEGGAPPMAGLQTAGGKSVTVSDASKHKAAHLFDEGGAPPMAGLQTAGGKSVTVSDASKHKAAHLFDEGGAPPMAGLQTAGGKSVTVSDASKHKAAHLFDEGGAPPMAGLQTAGGKSVTVSDASKHKAAHLFDEGGAPPMAGLQTAGGKSVTVSDASKHKAAHLFDKGGAPSATPFVPFTFAPAVLPPPVARPTLEPPPRPRTTIGTILEYDVRDDRAGRARLDRWVGAAVGLPVMPPITVRTSRAGLGQRRPDLRCFDDAYHTVLAVTDGPTPFDADSIVVRRVDPETMALPLGLLKHSDGGAFSFADAHLMFELAGRLRGECTLGWLREAYAQAVWKLSSFQALTQDPLLTPARVLSDLRRRHESEFVEGRRPILRRITEQDVPASVHMVLFVRDLVPGGAVVSDGAYSLRASFDEQLTALVGKGAIVVGTKLHIANAGVTGLDKAGSPLSSEAVLMLHVNSTRRAKHTTPLGRQPDLLSVPLASVRPNGGDVPALACVVTRVYPLVYFVKGPPGRIICGASFAASESARAAHDSRGREALVTKAQEEAVQAVCERLEAQGDPEALAVRGLLLGRQLEDETADVEAVRKAMDRARADVSTAIEARVRAAFLDQPSDQPTPLQRLRLREAGDSGGEAVLTIWRPREVPELGARLCLLNAAAGKRAGELTLTKRAVMVPLKGRKSVAAIPVRTGSDCGALSLPKEVDMAGAKVSFDVDGQVAVVRGEAAEFRVSVPHYVDVGIWRGFLALKPGARVLVRSVQAYRWRDGVLEARCLDVSEVVAQ
ncbi:Breast cancer type 2-like susceptibility protein BRCA2-like [Carpediemonas membranifera]|uniref:Breast cancer type 2-like susceptibility protein BRCA2-like n=1 Tax=Carpediemonas membranifera TaxID=201153 RepID=A0A8J6E0F2_9EUKA|nr:Breast cancer type 2-like susceptibility protein BRCA2-like [Carpediemonas membranifera]|eukprot:KAG9395034.1 Breast cancer type 2-like susceptibility protein BRCA2-like [Carpediemonas membranifera]